MLKLTPLSGITFMISMLIDFTNIEEYIPHRPPFKMIDRCIVKSIELFEGYYTISKDNPLVDGEKPSNTIMIEFFAQTCASGFGYLTRDQEVEPGFIGSISKLTFYKNAKVGDMLHSIVKMQNRFENIQLISGEIYLGEELIMDCRMKIVEP